MLIWGTRPSKRRRVRRRCYSEDRRKAVPPGRRGTRGEVAHRYDFAATSIEGRSRLPHTLAVRQPVHMLPIRSRTVSLCHNLPCVSRTPKEVRAAAAVGRRPQHKAADEIPISATRIAKRALRSVRTVLFALYAMAEPHSHHYHSAGEDAFAAAKGAEVARGRSRPGFTLAFLQMTYDRLFCGQDQRTLQ